MRAFTVNSKDLFDLKKNPGLKLSVNSIEKNDNIPKMKIVKITDNDCPFCDKRCKTAAGLDKHLNGVHVR